MKNIVAYLQGGLGNQCFIYATAHAKAIARLLSCADRDVVCEACKKRVQERYSEESNYR